MTILTTDRLRVVQFAQGGAIKLIRDLLDGVTYAHVRDSFKITAPPKQRMLTTPTRRFGGQRVGSEVWENGALAATWLVTGTTPSAAMTNASLLLQQMEDLTPDQYLEWKPTGVSPSTYFELRGSADWQPDYSWVQWSARQVLQVTGRFSFAPLGLGDPMAILDTFALDSVASGEWVQAEGASGVVIANGSISAATNLSERKVFLARGRDYSYDDARIVVRFTTGATIATGTKVGGQLSNQTGGAASSGTNSVIEGYVIDDGTNTRLKIDVYLSGAATTIVNTILGTRLAANTTYWLVFQRQGSAVDAALFTTPPTPNQTPAVRTGWIKLTAAQRLAAGKAGFLASFGVATLAITDVSIEPYHYRLSAAGTSNQLPQVLSVPALPGDAPPRCDIDLGVFGGSQPVFGLVAAWPKPAAWNRVFNGDLVLDAPGAGPPVNWDTAANASFPTVAPTSTTIIQDPVPAPPIRGRKILEVATPATNNAGVYFAGLILDPSKTYYAEAWIRAATATGNLELAWGNPGNAAWATGTQVALTAAWQKITLVIDTTTTPGADPGSTTQTTILALRQKSATAQTWQVAGLALYEGSALPAGLLESQADGRGGLPVLGILDAEQSVGRPITTDAAGRMGSTLQFSTATSGSAEWLVDPSVCRPDEYSAGELDVEVWLRWFFKAATTNLVFTMSVQPEAGAGTGTPRYTTEWGSSGYTPVLPTADAWRFSRLGTLRMRCSPAAPARHRLRLSFTASANTGIKLDYLACVPLRRRSCSPTARAQDATYPALFPSSWSGSSDATKTILQDGGGVLTTPGPGLERSTSPWPEHGFGFPVMLDPGTPLELLVKLSTLVPDDPTASAASEQLSHVGHVALPLVPRYLLARPS